MARPHYMRCNGQLLREGVADTDPRPFGIGQQRGPVLSCSSTMYRHRLQRRQAAAFSAARVRRCHKAWIQWLARTLGPRSRRADCGVACKLIDECCVNSYEFIASPMTSPYFWRGAAAFLCNVMRRTILPAQRYSGRVHACATIRWRSLHCIMTCHHRCYIGGMRGQHRGCLACTSSRCSAQ